MIFYLEHYFIISRRHETLVLLEYGMGVNVLYLSCSCRVGVKYSATRSVSTAMSMVATPSASTPLAQKFATRSFTVM
jgi:hypothetical protein